MTLGPWEASPTFSADLAQLVRACVRQEQRLLKVDPWLPFPQTSCSFAFGPDAKPLPIGALFALWSKCPGFTTTCVACGGRVRGYTCCALAAVGNVSGVCETCARPYTRFVGGVAVAREVMGPLLEHTEFHISRSSTNGCFPGPREPLFRALYDLGEWNI